MKKLINETETFVDVDGVEHTIVRTVERDSILDIFKKKDSEDVVEPTDKKIDFKKIGKRAAIVGAAGAAILGGIAISRHHAAKKNNSDEDDRYITVNTTNDSDDETPAEETEPQETEEDSDVTNTTF